MSACIQQALDSGIFPIKNPATDNGGVFLIHVFVNANLSECRAFF